MASKRAAKRGRKTGIPAGSDGSVELGLNGVPVEPQVTEKPPPEPQVTEKPPPEPAEVEDEEEEEEVEGSQSEDEEEKEQSDLQSASNEGTQSGDEEEGEESMEEEAAGESASALQSPSKGKSGGKKPAPSARDAVAEKSPPPGNKRRRSNEEPVPSPSPTNKRNMVTRSHQPEVPAPEEHEPEDKGHEPEDPEEHEPEDKGHEPEDPEEHEPEDEGAGIIKLKKNNKKMRKPAPEEHEPEDQGAEVIKSKNRNSERIKPAQQQGEPSTSKEKRIRREWAPDDEVLILEQIVNYRHTHGHPPEIKDNGFFESVREQLGDQSLGLRSVKDKMCSLRRRYENKHNSTTEHGKRLDNLSKEAWGKPFQVGAKDSSGSNLSKKALRKPSRVGAKDSSGSKTGGKSFEEMRDMYPLLAQEVELIADIDPSAKSSFTRIDAEVACKLEKQLDAVKAKVSQVRKTLAGVLAEAC